MKKYRVLGSAEAIISKEVLANDEQEAYEKAFEDFPYLTTYFGREMEISYDRVECDGIELIKDYYMECPNCGKELEEHFDDCGNETSWFCPECDKVFDDDGEEI